MTLHDLRHTAASLAISAGANVKAVQRMLGHASAAMTLDTYADLFDDDLDAVSEGLDAAYEKSLVGKMWANGQTRAKKATNPSLLAGSRERRRRDLNPRNPYGFSTLAGWCTRPNYATSPAFTASIAARREGITGRMPQ